jgi:transcriptional regulator with XRE-family HTH domain
MVTVSGFGPQLRTWRLSRRLSQEALASRAEISARHLNFVENGRANPSRELVLALSEVLEIPLRERNTLLTLAGFAAVYRASPLEGAELLHLRRAIGHILRQQEPYGAFVINGSWEVLEVNAGAARLIRQFPPQSEAGAKAASNMLLAVLHPEALRPYLVNWNEVARLLLARLHRDNTAAPRDTTQRLLATALAMPGIPTDWRTLAPGQSAAPFVTLHLRSPQLELRLFSMLTSIGTPLDVTTEELHIETYFPADQSSEDALRRLASAAAPSHARRERASSHGSATSPVDLTAAAGTTR